MHRLRPILVLVALVTRSHIHGHVPARMSSAVQHRRRSSEGGCLAELGVVEIRACTGFFELRPSNVSRPAYRVVPAFVNDDELDQEP